MHTKRLGGMNKGPLGKIYKIVLRELQSNKKVLFLSTSLAHYQQCYKIKYQTPITLDRKNLLLLLDC